MSGKALVVVAPHQLAFETFDHVALQANEVRIKTLYSGISAGTELTQYRGTTPFLHKRWDADKRLFLPDDATSLTYPIRSLGYEEVGEVVEVGAGVSDIPIGCKLFGTWGHRTHYIAPADYVYPRRMVEGLDPLAGIFSHLGAIALNGIHDGHIRLGDTVAVFGLGALGQIVVQAAVKSGAKVIGVDLHESRLEMARNNGASITLNAADKPAEAIKELTEGRGADVCFEVSGSTLALNEAVRAATYSGRVVAMGFFQGEAKGLYLGEEFHHSRINIVGSQISGVDPELKYRWDKLRLWQTAIRLQAEGVLKLTPLVSHIAPFEQAQTLFEQIDQSPELVMLAVLDFRGA